ncbi:MAG TPA: protein kinase [Polyangiaceae bacterium]|nr:protein kinase [Polyangiaceae bacterium]
MAESPPPPSSLDRPPARMVGALLSDRYRITSLIGEGGMGEVYLGEHVLMRKRVAIKVLHPDMMMHDEIVARFEREAMAAAHIDHPNVAAATDFGRTPEGSFFLVLEYIEGRSLREMLAGLGALPAARALHIVRQVTAALARAHELGIVHRDLKPENVMLVVRGQDTDFVKVLDFGIAKVPVQELTGKATVVHQLTRMGVMYGTPEYMAPEQALGQQVDHRADLYALGVMLYEMVTGSRPFEAADPVSLVAQHITVPPQPPSARNPQAEVPKPVEDLVLRLLQKDAQARPASAEEVIEAIDEILGGAPRGAGPASVAYGRQPSSVALPRPPSGSAWSLPSGPPANGGEGAPPGEAAAARTGVASQVAYLPTHVAAAPADGEPATAPAGPLARRGLNATALRTQARAALEPLRTHLPVVATRTRVALEGVRAKLPPRFGRLPLAALAFAFALPPVALLVLILATVGGPAAPPETGKEPAGDGGIIGWVSPPTSASPSELEAAGSSPEALTTLAERFPKDQKVRAALVRAYGEQRRHREAAAAARELAALEPAPPIDDGVMQALRAAALAPDAEADAFALLESLPGTQGPNVLYDLSTAKDAPPRAQAAAQRSLQKPEVRAKASPALAIYLDFKQAKDCDERHALLPRVIEVGDKRMTPLLKPLLNRRGCGSGGVFRIFASDCHPCLRNDTLLTDAVAAVANRNAEP